MARPVYVCPICRSRLNRSGGLVCRSCGASYRIRRAIPDLYYDAGKWRRAGRRLRRTRKDSDARYASTADLETRVKYFRSRFSHSLRLPELFSYLDTFGRVLEVGCGTMRPLLPVGDSYAGRAVWGIDAAPGHLLPARLNVPAAELARANACALPFEDNVFDIVWARHMLYDVKVPEQALAQGRRCLADDGVLCATTNSAHNKTAMREFHRRMLEAVGLPPVMVSSGARRFSAEDAEQRMRKVFEHVFVIDYEGTFQFQESSEFVEYYASTRYFRGLVTADITRERLLDVATRLADQAPIPELSNNGAIAIATDSATRYRELRTLLETARCTAR